MAHFAELDNGNIVVRVVVVDDQHEANGEAWCNNLWGGIWKQTSYNGTIRKQYANKGMTYDSVKDKFITPQPYPSWTLDINDDWKAPVAYPTVIGVEGVVWNESALNWEEST
tara:strand:+ start:1449 stop:1784 length:336 start_codon:yes stop_codon:yes gene_type:complete